ncbi:MAG: hypothetical protein HWD58_01505 [Bacteroidota bacterium]|nr:MAG: hypothetical protein HWD58_01505 [Bacteroidota bacterium]
MVPSGSFLEDRQGRIWVGTRENGINCIQPKTWNVKQYNTSSFPFLRIMGYVVYSNPVKDVSWLEREKVFLNWLMIETIVPVFPKENSIRTSTLKSISVFIRIIKADSGWVPMVAE